MIQVVERAFAVLEYVAGQSHPVLPAEVVAALKLTQPTASRLLRDLCELGYLEQSGPRKGYGIGPVPFRLAPPHRNPDGLFLEEAGPLLRATARELGQAVLFATRHRHWRMIRLHYNYNPAFALDLGRLRYHDLYCTVSGRLLLAYAPESDLYDVIEKLGEPAARPLSAGGWPEAAGGMERFLAELERIRRAGFLELASSGCGNFHCAAFPVFRRRRLLGAVAANWPVDSDAELTRRCLDALEELAGRLSRRTVPQIVIG